MLTIFRSWKVAKGRTENGAQALHVAIETVAKPKLARQRPVVVLLLTDGDDTSFRQVLVDYRQQCASTTEVSSSCREHSVLSQLGTHSGLSLHFVGICSDADTLLLDGLAELAHGTFVSLRDGTDMRGLMGSLLGLAMDQMHEAALLSLYADAGGEGDSIIIIVHGLH